MPENVLRILVCELSALDLQNHLYEHVRKLSTQPALLRNVVSHSRSEIPSNGGPRQVCFVLVCFVFFALHLFMYSAKNSCTATFSHLFIGPSSRPMESYSDGMKEEIQWREREGRKCVWGGFSQRKNYKDQIINILELRKKKRRKKRKTSPHHFLLFILFGALTHIAPTESSLWSQLSELICNF